MLKVITLWELKLKCNFSVRIKFTSESLMLRLKKKQYILINLNKKINCDFKSGYGFGKNEALMLTMDVKS